MSEAMGVAAFLILLLPLAQEGHSVLALLLKSRLAQQRGQLELALQLAEQACGESPASADSHFQQAEILVELLGRRSSLLEEEKLLRLLLDGMNRFPDDFRFSGALGRLLVDQPAMARQVPAPSALVCLQRSLEKIDPALPELVPDRADTLALLGQVELGRDPLAASRYLTKALALMPEMEWAWLQAAQSLERAGLLRSARHCYRQFLEGTDYIPASSRWSAQGAVLRLSALLEPGQESLDALQTFLKENAGENALHWDFVDFFARYGAFSQVLALLSSMPQVVREHVQFGLMQARILVLQGSYDEALEVALLTLDRFPQGEPSRHLFSLALEAALLCKAPVSPDRLTRFAPLVGQQDLSRLQWAALQNSREDWFELESDHPFVVAIRQYGRREGSEIAFAILKARLAVAHQMPRLALPFYEDLPNSLVSRESELQLEMADAYALAGQTERAFRMYQRLLHQKRDSPSLYNNYGYFLLLEGRELAKAQQLVERSLQMDPSCVSCLDSMGWALFRSGEADQARLFLEKALLVDAKDPVKLEHLGDVMAALGRQEDAERYWSLCLSSRDELHLSRTFFQLLDKLDPP